MPVPDRGLVLLTSETDLRAYDRAGLRWKTDRLAWDSLQVLGIKGDHADVVGFDAYDDDFRPMLVDLETGKSTDSAYRWDDSLWREPVDRSSALRRLASCLTSRLRSKR